MCHLLCQYLIVLHNIPIVVKRNYDHGKFNKKNI